MLISPAQALRIVLSNARPLRPRSAALDGALGYWLAEDVRSDRDQPPADRAAMDGYAVIAADLRPAPARLRLIGEVAAGGRAVLRVRRGTCAAILTGASVPAGADTVIPVEQTESAGNVVIFRARLNAGANIRKRGEEAARGQVLLQKHTRLGPTQIGICAMVGKARVKVYSQPSVAVICTGAEVRQVGQRTSPHQLRDSNGPALVAALAEQGFGGASRCIVGDDPGAIAARLKRALRSNHVVIVTGGVSVGRYDYVPEAIKRIGGKICFHGVRAKPGRPQLYARLAGKKHVFGLPGNPVSVLTVFHEIVLPGLRKLCGAGDDAACRPILKLPLARKVLSKGNRAYFALARLLQTKDGPAVRQVNSKGSADIIAACEADGVIVIPAGVRELPAGAVVEFRTWKRQV